MHHLHAPVLTWINGNGSIQSYRDRVIVTDQYRFTFSSSQVVQIAYSDHIAVKCKMDINKFCRRGPIYWKLNKSIFNSEKFPNRIKELLMWSSVLNSHRWFGLKRAVCFESIRFSIQLSL